MEFGAFERLVLRVLFETQDPLTTPHLAYLAGISVQKAERYLGRMVEEGTLTPRLGAHEVIEYTFAGRREIDKERQTADRQWRGLLRSAGARVEGPLGEGRGEPPLDDLVDDAEGEPNEDQEANAATAVLLSVLVPGAGHIYAGRSGAGVAWMATTLVGYACCLLPGLFLHGLCLVSAAHARQAP
jgi:predicted transcriptional regulator